MSDFAATSTLFDLEQPCAAVCEVGRYVRLPGGTHGLIIALEVDSGSPSGYWLVKLMHRGGQVVQRYRSDQLAVLS